MHRINIARPHPLSKFPEALARLRRAADSLISLQGHVNGDEMLVYTEVCVCVAHMMCWPPVEGSDCRAAIVAVARAHERSFWQCGHDAGLLRVRQARRDKVRHHKEGSARVTRLLAANLNRWTAWGPPCSAEVDMIFEEALKAGYASGCRARRMVVPELEQALSEEIVADVLERARFNATERREAELRELRERRAALEVQQAALNREIADADRAVNVASTRLALTLHPKTELD